MIIKYNTELLNRIIKNIFDLTGISIAVLDTSYKSLARREAVRDYCSLLQETEAETLRCRECDSAILEKCALSKKLEKHICFAGLYDAAMPILKNDVVVGFAIMGRVRSANSPLSPHLIPNTDGKTIKELKKLYQKLPFITEDKLEALYDLLSFVIFDSAIQIVYDPLMNEILDFIDSSFCEAITIDCLCSRFHISKNRLYKAFNDNLGTTVNQYITERRLSLAKSLLLSSDKPVYQIAQEAGIDNYTYFCRLFRQRTGLTPKQYRQKALNKTM